MLLRFYMARSRQVEAAAAMHGETVTWREAFDLQSVMSAFPGSSLWGFRVERVERVCRVYSVHRVYRVL